MNELAISSDLTLVTARLRLRTWQTSDAPQLHDLLSANHERLRLNFPKTLAATRTLEDTAAFIRERQRDWQQRRAYQLGLWRAETEELLGLVSLRNLAWEIPKAELAYLISAEAEGQGLMREALGVVLHWAYQEIGLARIYCQLRPENLRSAQLVQRLQFRHEGCFRQDYRGADGRLYDLDQYALLRSEYVPLATKSV
ncbi:GNAT family N-acetyltransferase [Hymenobacter taeanensis]|uniref:GNAT family N-acetyltransferase n=1 Tax=Hymenobacter taeanensis TaxID=2735321 RepID=A0A6M6BDS4_9BACT|nr:MULTISPECIES: GNAT family protein [Hymenobacter]QJX45998.1 GNAT family N-acetyltransferase [Hymenobacter taeanensis]UOQ79850.1 GNAT family N-acetyltransferase [Hymenobacter sp. 5414T-23]